MTGTELARRVGAAGKEVVSVWENRSSPPDQPFLSRLAMLFGVTEAWLLHGDAALEATSRQALAEAEARGYQRAINDLSAAIDAVADQLRAREANLRAEHDAESDDTFDEGYGDVEAGGPRRKDRPA